MLTKIYNLTWDYEDSRFSPFDNTYWTSQEKMWEKVKEKVKSRLENLRCSCEEDGFDIDTQFDEWFEYCKQFAYVSEIKIEN
jgi:hypothetical protein